MAKLKLKVECHQLPASHEGPQKRRTIFESIGEKVKYDAKNLIAIARNRLFETEALEITSGDGDDYNDYTLLPQDEAGYAPNEYSLLVQDEMDTYEIDSSWLDVDNDVNDVVSEVRDVTVRDVMDQLKRGDDDGEFLVDLQHEVARQLSENRSGISIFVEKFDKAFEFYARFVKKFKFPGKRRLIEMASCDNFAKAFFAAKKLDPNIVINEEAYEDILNRLMSMGEEGLRLLCYEMKRPELIIIPQNDFATKLVNFNDEEEVANPLLNACQEIDDSDCARVRTPEAVVIGVAESSNHLKHIKERRMFETDIERRIGFDQKRLRRKEMKPLCPHGMLVLLEKMKSATKAINNDDEDDSAMTTILDPSSFRRRKSLLHTMFFFYTHKKGDKFINCHMRPMLELIRY